MLLRSSGNVRSKVHQRSKRRSDAVRKPLQNDAAGHWTAPKSLGYRLGAVAGQLTREHAVAIADLADSIIDEFGVTKIADLTERIKAYIPDVSDSEHLLICWPTCLRWRSPGGVRPSGGKDLRVPASAQDLSILCRQMR